MFLIGLALLVFLSSCLPASAPPTIKLGLVAPFSGRDQALGYNMLFAAKLALQEWNQRGGVGGYYLELVAQDDSNQAEMGSLQARKMALDRQVVGVIGHPSGESASAAAPVYREAGLPAMLLGMTLPGEDGGPPVFRMAPTASQLGEEAANFASAQGARRLVIVAETTPSAQVLAQEVGRGAKKAGLEVALDRVITPGRDDVGAIHESPLLELKGARPGLVFYSGGYVEGGELLAAMRAQGLAAAFLGGPGLASPDFLKIAGPAAAGAYYQSMSIYPAHVPEAQRFVEAYRAMAGIDPWPQALQVYDGVNAMLEELDGGRQRGQRPGRGALGQELAQGAYQGLSGPLSFNEKGERQEGRGYIYHLEGMAWPGRRVR